MENLGNTPNQNPDIDHLILIDGSNYHQIIISDLALFDVDALLNHIQNITSRGEELRILFDKRVDAQIFLQRADFILAGVEVSHGLTTYFELNSDNLHLIEYEDWYIFNDQFDIYEEQFIADDLLNCMVKSFARGSEVNSINPEKVNRIKKMPRNIITSQTRVYTLRDKAMNLLGTFTFHVPPDSDELQVHSVGGRVDGVYRFTPNKFRYILSAIMYLYLSDNRYREKKVTFNSRFAAQLYLNSGFMPSDRYGIVFKK